MKKETVQKKVRNNPTIPKDFTIAVAHSPDNEEFREVAKEYHNRFRSKSSQSTAKRRITESKSRRVWPDFVVFIVISILLWVFIALF